MQSPRQPEPGPDPAQGVFAISVAAELVGLAPRNLRQYEERGLLEPARTDGGTRRYSSDDVLRLRRIGELLAAGLNTAGVSLVLDLERRNEQLQLALDQHQALVEHQTPDQHQTPHQHRALD